MNFTNLQIEIWQSTLYIVNNQMSTYVPKNYRLKYDEVWAGKYIINPQMSLLQSYPRLWYSFRKQHNFKTMDSIEWKRMHLHLRLNQYLGVLRQHFKSWKHLKRVALTIWDKRYFPGVYFAFKSKTKFYIQIKFEITIWRGSVWKSGTKGIIQKLTLHLNLKLNF